MIQDRLTAKFQSAKSAAKRETRPQTTATPKAKTVTKPATDSYTAGRKLVVVLYR